MIWEPFVMALVLGLVVSAGLYYAYLWPSVEPLDEDEAPAPPGAAVAPAPDAADPPTEAEPAGAGAGT